MPTRARRLFTPEYRLDAVYLVFDGHRSVGEVARELDVHENLLHKWVREVGPMVFHSIHPFTRLAPLRQCGVRACGGGH